MKHKALTKWEKATQELATAFAAEYFVAEYLVLCDGYWVGDEVGGVFEVNGYFFGLQRMVDALRLEATFEQLIDYYELEMEGVYQRVEGVETLVNFSNYVKFGLKLNNGK